MKTLKVVLADLGCAELATPDSRFLWKPKPSETYLPFCTAQYRSPDILLGSQRFGPDLDLWSLGCMAAELFLRKPLFQPKGGKPTERSLLEEHFAFLGTPPSGSRTSEWMKSLPFVENFYGKDAQRLEAKAPPEWPPKTLRDCPPQLADFVRQTLQLHPQERLTAASASLHSFVSSRALSVTVAVAKGKTG